jgi:mannitol-specific phosphotransferase system IIBC component
MTEQELAKEIAVAVLRDVKFWSAIIGLVGVILGASISIIGNIILFRYQQKNQNKLDAARKKLLKQMLDNEKFKEGRSFDTLSKVTGAEPEDCRRLLIEIDARGFTLKDGREGWTYIKNRPIATQ